MTLDVFLMNGHKICVNLMSTDQTDDVLEVTCSTVILSQSTLFTHRDLMPNAVFSCYLISSLLPGNFFLRFSVFLTKSKMAAKIL